VRLGKKLGVDDYLTKPFEPADLLAIIQGKLARAQELAGSRQEDVLAVGDVVVDPQRRQATAAGRSLRLTPTQFDILLALAHADGRLLSCRDIVSQVYGHRMSEREARALLRPHLTALRRQLNPDPETPPRLINVRGAGYRLADEPVAGTEQ
jgi:DNA-binding response OmpR family regulator